MKIDISKLAKSEQAALLLSNLYLESGYQKYKMTHFEEYSLYADNLDFLTGKEVITFTGRNGKLMALRPDVTLSIVKSTKASETNTEKLFYNENVYRLSDDKEEYKEINQIGVEVIGKIDGTEKAEIVKLALNSLEVISEDFVLAISNISFVSGLIESFGIKDSLKGQLLELLKSKNTHDIKNIDGLDDEQKQQFAKLVNLSGSPDMMLKEASELVVNSKMQTAFDDIQNLWGLLKGTKFAGNLQFDFSTLGNENYYNGLVFNGYVKGLPKLILVGGQYDNLLTKFGIKGSAIGFAMYLNEVANIKG